MKKLILSLLKYVNLVLQDIKRGSAFIYRDYRATRRNLGWYLANTLYYIISGLSVVFIGVASNDPKLTTTLFIGVIMWGYLSIIFEDIAQSITYEKWESTIEYTFMAPVSRASHLFCTSLYVTLSASLKSLLLAIVCLYMFDLSFTILQVLSVVLIIIISTLSFIGIGLLAAILPLLSTEHGGQAVCIVQGLLLLISGVYYPIEVLPPYIQIFSYISPATYTINACRSILIDNLPLSSIYHDLAMLLIISTFLIPLGLIGFSIAERYTKIHGNLKRNG